MDTITQNVKKMYEQYPYPYTDVKGELLDDLLMMIYYLFSESGISLEELDRYSFFDAGCGSGQRILRVAQEFSNARFTCVDLTQHSLDIARKQAQRQGIKNVNFRQADLVRLEEDGRYDIVTSVGVLHHLSEPGKALERIAPLVKHDGLMIIHVYHSLGEHERMLKRKIVRTLMGNDSIDTGVQIMKQLGYTLPNDQYGSLGYNENLTQQDRTAKDVDVYIHPRVFTYLFEEGLDLFNVTDLDWAAIHSINSLKGSYLVSTSYPVETYSFDPSSILNTPFLLERYQQLPMIDKLRFIECVTEPTAFSIVAGRHESLSKIGPRLKNNIIRLKDGPGESLNAAAGNQ